jgi:hypothetical protein
MYEIKKVVDQGVVRNGEKLPSRKQLEVDDPSKVGFWPSDNATASGQDEIAPNFSNPFGGKSRGTK